jgi:serine/threonine-protein kinase HipA
LPDAWGTLLLRRRLLKLGHRFEELNVVDRLALAGRLGQGLTMIGDHLAAIKTNFG